MKTIASILLLTFISLAGCGGSSESTSSNSELDDLGITIGEGQTMTGEEFQKFLAEQNQNGNPNETFLYIKINENLGPTEREEKYGQPIEEILSKEKLGSVTGGGTMMNLDGTFKYIGLDIATENPDDATAAIIKKLREIGAPKDTVILREIDGEETEIPAW